MVANPDIWLMTRRVVYFWSAALLLSCSAVFARTQHTGHLVVALTDKETGGPITNAEIVVKVDTSTSLSWYASPKYVRTVARTGTNGVADVEFGFVDDMFSWNVRTPSHYSRTMEGTDVHINLEPAEGKYNRYFLLTPTQHQALVDFINRPAAWGYLYTCADWAHDAFLIASGESVSASDYTFGTPRAISKSINKLESITATNIMNPLDGGEEPSPKTSTSGAGEGGWTGDSFPSSL